MTTTILHIPELQIQSATVAKWLVKPGDFVVYQQPVLSLETDKITLDLVATLPGRIIALLLDTGDEVRSGIPFLNLDPAAINLPELLMETAKAERRAEIIFIEQDRNKDTEKNAAFEAVGKVDKLMRQLISAKAVSETAVDWRLNTYTNTIQLTFKSTMFFLSSELVWNSSKNSFTRIDTIDPVDAAGFNELLGRSPLEDRTTHEFEYRCPEEAALAYASWLGWAIAVLASDQRRKENGK